MYQAEIFSKARKSIRKASKHLKEAYEQRITEIRRNPYLADPLKEDLKGWWSYHFTYKGVPYRIIYKIYPEEKLLLIAMADTRENIYKELRRLGRFYK